MKKRLNRTSLYFSLGMMAAAMLIGSLAKAQSTASQSSTTPAATTKAKGASAGGTQTTNAKNSAHASETLSVSGKTTHDVVEYKDGEDMTTRYRPGNNKTTTALPATPPTGQPADAATKKHLAGVKYEDRQASSTSLEGASKDASKDAVSGASATTVKPK